MTTEQINNIFMYHAPKEVTRLAIGEPRIQTERYELLRREARRLGLLINDACPESREKSLAFTKLQEAIMFANAAIAINE